MNDIIEISWMTDSIDEARKVCRYLVQERLVATAQIVPWVESIYRWNNQVETVQESKVVLKTRLNLFEKIKEVITKNCHYEIPELIYHHVDGGLEGCLQWINESATDLPTSELK